jgi:monooxygenase
MHRRPLMNFAAGYVMRGVDRFPRQGSAAPWRINMSEHPVDDGVLRFTAA